MFHAQVGLAASAGLLPQIGASTGWAASRRTCVRICCGAPLSFRHATLCAAVQTRKVETAGQRLAVRQQQQQGQAARPGEAGVAAALAAGSKMGGSAEASDAESGEEDAGFVSGEA